MAIDGFHVLRGWLSSEAQNGLIAACRAVAAEAPFFTPTMPNGAPFRVEMTNAGAWGWVSDASGYRYADRHPCTGRPWPEPPAPLERCVRGAVVEALGQAAGDSFEPQCYLINHYRAERGRLGLHRDYDERDRTQPIVTISLGADAVFLAGGLQRRDRVERLTLRSGDLVVMGGPSRLAYHGIEKLLPTIDSPLPGGSRFSITARRVDPAEPAPRRFQALQSE